MTNANGHSMTRRAQRAAVGLEVPVGNAEMGDNWMSITQKRAAKRIGVRLLVIGVISYFLVTSSVFNTGSQAQEAVPTPADAEEALTKNTGTEKAAEENTATEKTADASTEEQKKAKANAEALLKALSNNVSSTPQANDTSLDASVTNLGSEDEKDTDKGLRAKLTDKEKAGKLIHQLRMKGLVPIDTMKWTAYVPYSEEDAKKDEEAKDKPKNDALLGIVTLMDNRVRSIKVSIDSKTRLVAAIDRPTPKDLKATEQASALLKKILTGDEGIQEVWNNGAPVPTFFNKDQKKRTWEEFKADLEQDDLLQIKSNADGSPAIEWKKKDSQIEGGYRINGTATIDHEGEDVEVPFFVVFLDGPDGLQLLDVQSTAGFTDRFLNGTGDTLDLALFIVLCALILGMLYMVYRYYTGLRNSPREIWLLFFTKVTEYSAYGAAQLAFMFYLRDDLGLSDLGAGTYYSAWSTILTCLTMVVGAVCDAIGVKRTLLVGAVCLLVSRAIMPFAGDVGGIWMASLLGFLPLAIGIAITGPVLSVGVKKFTTMEGAAMGFAAFYTLMNVGWAVGAWIFDAVRTTMGEMGSVNVLGAELSTYEVIIGIGFFINLPDFVAIVMMRRGVEMTESGMRIEKFAKADKSKGMLATMFSTVRTAAKDTARIFGENFVQKAFWIFILLIGMTVFARLTFFHFHLTWPSYGARYLGQGSLVGNIFGVWNPVLIVILTPLMGIATRKISSYKMLLIGTVISVGSIAFVVVDQSIYTGLCSTWLGSIIFDRWLEVPEGFRDPFYMGMFVFVTVFTVGEAIWSPRLMQFTAEIAPPGREGSYVALAYLPYFGAKFIAGPMAGILLGGWGAIDFPGYTPEFGIDGIYMNYPDHQLIWWWIAGTAALTPVGLIAFRKLYSIAEKNAQEAAAKAAKEALAQQRDGAPAA